MTATCDLIVRGGRVVDAANDIDEFVDITASAGKVVDVGPALSYRSSTVIDARGAYVFPGLVDLHVHLVSDLGPIGPKALVRAGVTTALDVGGPVVETVATVRAASAAVNVASLEILWPGRQLPARPKATEIRAAIERVLDAGGLGVKLHIEAGWDPETTAAVIAEGNALRAWVAVHCGTTTAGSDIEGMAQAVQLAGEHTVQIAHVNSYCRGDVTDPVREGQKAIELLRSAPHHFAESYLASLNGTFVDPTDKVPRPRISSWLANGGYDATTQGIRKAVLDGWAGLIDCRDDEIVLIAGSEGVAVWDDADAPLGMCLPINPASSRILLATSRGRDRRFDVHALASDGGVFPRNVTVSSGLALVEFGALTLRELVEKACWAPARMLGLHSKGHLAVGADADMAIVDSRSSEVTSTVIAGNVVLHRGVLFGGPSRIISTVRGRDAVIDADVTEVALVDVEKSGFYTTSDRAPEPMAGTRTGPLSPD